MQDKNQLPKLNKKKIINMQEVVRLARKVKKYLEEEAQYLQNKNQNYGNNKSGKFEIPS